LTAITAANAMILRIFFIFLLSVYMC